MFKPHSFLLSERNDNKALNSIGFYDELFWVFINSVQGIIYLHRYLIVTVFFLIFVFTL